MDVREQFERDVAEHGLTVLRDDDLYRHLRCQKPDSYTYGFDIITWPGYLVICGDAGDFMFSRLADMLEFFENDHGQINPHYWSEKLRGPRHSRDVAERYSPEKYERRVREWLDEKLQWDFTLPEERTGNGRPTDVLSWLDEIEHDWPERDIEAALALREEVEWQLLPAPSTEEEAYERLRAFQHGTTRIDDFWEWDLRDYDFRFLWCCHAIVWAIAQYRQAVPVAA